MKTSLFLVGAALLVIGTGAQAQQRGFGGNGNGNGRNNAGNNRGGNNGGAALPLPEGVESVVSIDAFNILLAQTNRDGRRDLSPSIVRHIYSGGVAKLFGGGSIPTEQFVTPGALGGGNGGSGIRGGGQNGGFGGQNSGFGGNNGFGGVQNGGFQGGGFQGGGFGGAGNIGAFQMRPSAFRGRN